VKRIAFVVQRYGLEVNGGAEHHCRRLAEQLRSEFEVEVLTTCALDYLTWKNHYPEGVELLNGVPVRRFRTDFPRRIRAFGRFADRLYVTPHTFSDEAEWIRRQGPHTLGLLRHLREREADYDLFIFFTYLYFPTLLGLPLVPWKAVLVPTAHDEPPLSLDCFRPLFHLPRGIIYNTEEERALIQGRFRNQRVPWEVIGAGVDPVSDADPARFRRRYGIEGDYLLYVGRVDVKKGCRELVGDFLRFRQTRGHALTLVLVGGVEMALPRHPALAPLGFLPEVDKNDALAGALALVAPSPFESLSLVALEAWALGVPVLARAASPVLAGHCQRSGGGLTYDDDDGFGRGVERLLAEPALRRQLGECGRQYVDRGYRWPPLLDRYRRFLETVLKESAT
jgi:glycosyltransferase involved in cell wall biosynthesis